MFRDFSNVSPLTGPTGRMEPERQPDKSVEEKAIVLRPRNCAPVLFLLILFLHAGCAARKRLTPPPAAPPPTRVETVEDAKSLLLRNYGKANSVKAGGHLQIRSFEEERWRPASFALMLQRPDRVRVRAYRPLAPTMFELVSDGQRCWLFVPSERTAYLSEDCEAIHAGNENIAAPAGAIVAAIVVVSDFDSLFSMPARLYSEADTLRLVFTEETGAYREIWIDPETGLATRQSLIGADGTLDADIVYKEHTSDGEAGIPTEIEVNLPRVRASMLLRIDDFQIDAKLPADAFDFSPPNETTIRDIQGVPRN